MSSWARFRGLPLTIEHAELQGLVKDVTSTFTRRTTVFRLHGLGHEGIGEDVTYDGNAQLALQAAGPEVVPAGEHTLASFSALVGELPGYTPWALESAALDLALRQAGLPLWRALDLVPRPVSFVISSRLDPYAWLALYPGLRFKLDAEPKWTPELVTGLAATGAVDVVDLKGHYRGTSVDLDADPALYRLVAEGFPGAWIEDPWLTPETDVALRGHRDRITYDGPIHSVADVEALPFRPRCLNSKPSRFGSLERLLDFYDYCEEKGIALYGGGQFELGPGRGQIQYLASLFHADAPNDVAPSGFNAPAPVSGLPQSPLPPAPSETGFRFG